MLHPFLYVWLLYVCDGRWTKFLENFAKIFEGLSRWHWCSHLSPVNRTETAVLKVFLGILGWNLVREPLTRLLKALKAKFVEYFPVWYLLCRVCQNILMLTCFNRTRAVLLISSRATLALKASCKALCTKHSKLIEAGKAGPGMISLPRSNFHPVHVLPAKLPSLSCAHCRHRGNQGGKNRQCLGLRLSPDCHHCYHIAQEYWAFFPSFIYSN